jgi:Fe-S-cluster containining protein
MSKWLNVLNNDGDIRPPLPSAGIPKQRLPAAVRRTIQYTVLPFVLLDVVVQRLVSIVLHPPYRREGQCKMRGKCCRFLVQEQSSRTEVFRSFQWWAFEINGFYERDFEVDNGDDTQYKVFSCRHLSQKGRCQNYRLRPTICRMWPRVNFFGPSSILKGCGYRLVPRVRATQETVVQIETNSPASGQDKPV